VFGLGNLGRATCAGIYQPSFFIFNSWHKSLIKSSFFVLFSFIIPDFKGTKETLAPTKELKEITKKQYENY
jgi:hypothetical protein